MQSISPFTETNVIVPPEGVLSASIGHSTNRIRLILFFYHSTLGSTRKEKKIEWKIPTGGGSEAQHGQRLHLVDFFLVGKQRKGP